MRVFQEKNEISRNHTFNKQFSHEFKENKNHNQLSTFYKSEESSNFREFCQLLQTFYSWLFKKDQNSHSNDEKTNEFRMNCKNRRNLQSF